MRRHLLVFSTVLLAIGISAPALAQRSGSAGPCASGNVATTASYRMALAIGHQEEMYLPSEVKARHIKTGEIMLGGEMTMVAKTPGTKVFHVEVHICTKSTGAVVTKLKPLIVVSGPGIEMASMKVPSAIMVGVGERISDYHYGNDVALKPGSRITVKVTVKGQLAVFHATVPR
jgi:hypothetical protein